MRTFSTFDSWLCSVQCPLSSPICGWKAQRWNIYLILFPKRCGRRTVYLWVCVCMAWAFSWWWFAVITKYACQFAPIHRLAMPWCWYLCNHLGTQVALHKQLRTAKTHKRFFTRHKVTNEWTNALSALRQPLDCLKRQIGFVSVHVAFGIFSVLQFWLWGNLRTRRPYCMYPPTHTHAHTVTALPFKHYGVIISNCYYTF